MADEPPPLPPDSLHLRQISVAKCFDDEFLVRFRRAASFHRFSPIHLVATLFVSLSLSLSLPLFKHLAFLWIGEQITQLVGRPPMRIYRCLCTRCRVDFNRNPVVVGARYVND